MRRHVLTVSVSLGLRAAVKLVAVQADDNLHEGKIKHVLLVSIDGLHALDLANYVKAHEGSALEELSERGVMFSNARSPANSDSFPGLLALVTGGSPRTHGLFYDYSYDRTIWAPDNKTCAGPPGTQMIFDESIDLYVGGVSQNVIDPNALPRYIDGQGHCSPLYPHTALRTNTLFGAVLVLGSRDGLVSIRTQPGATLRAS
jgi:Type I phosphodiesterase / nucleotide pyrophosphatase